MARGCRGSGRLRSGSNKPCASSAAFSRRKASYRLPSPARRIPSTLSCNSPRASYIVTSARTSTASPSRGVKSAYWLRPLNITQRICAPASLSEKYQWPLAARVKLEISPRTQPSGKLRSSNPAIRRLTSLTVSTSWPPRVGAAGAGVAWVVCAALAAWAGASIQKGRREDGGVVISGRGGAMRWGSGATSTLNEGEILRQPG